MKAAVVEMAALITAAMDWRSESMWEVEAFGFGHLAFGFYGGVLALKVYMFHVMVSLSLSHKF